MTQQVMLCRDVDLADVRALLSHYGLNLTEVPEGDAIPGSFWKDSEAGLVGIMVYARADTPIHSVLHEACHCICMDSTRRRALHTNAGGDYDEENAVCYLQILLADLLPGVGRDRLLADMDTWGYSFRLGSAQRWFEEDAQDARAWLIREGLIDDDARPNCRLRD